MPLGQSAGQLCLPDSGSLLKPLPGGTCGRISLYLHHLLGSEGVRTRMLVEQQTVSSWLSSGHQPPHPEGPSAEGWGPTRLAGGVDAAAEAQAGQPGHHSAAGLSCASAGSSSLHR